MIINVTDQDCVLNCLFLVMLGEEEVLSC